MFSVFIDNRLYLDFANGHYRVMAREHIPCGNLLLIDKGVKSTHDELISLFNNCFEFNQVVGNLYPRNNNLDDILNHNVFSDDVNETLYFNISMLNHCCKPNAAIADIVYPCEKYFSYSAIYAVNDIPANSEVCIMYNTKAGHLDKGAFSWNCQCGLDYTTRRGIFNDAIKAANEWHYHHSQINTEYINRYEKREESKTIAKVVAEFFEFRPLIDSDMEDEPSTHEEEDRYYQRYEPDMYYYALDRDEESLLLDLLTHDVPMDDSVCEKIYFLCLSLMRECKEYAYLLEELKDFAMRNNHSRLMQCLKISKDEALIFNLDNLKI